MKSTNTRHLGVLQKRPGGVGDLPLPRAPRGHLPSNSVRNSSQLLGALENYDHFRSELITLITIAVESPAD